jgi:hypothetical protein
MSKRRLPGEAWATCTEPCEKKGALWRLYRWPNYGNSGPLSSCLREAAWPGYCSLVEGRRRDVTPHQTTPRGRC